MKKFITTIRAALRISNRKSKKPDNTDFKQQRLPAWKPILTAQNVIPTIFLIGAAFVPIGIGMTFIANSVKEKVIPYTDCTNNQGVMCKDVIIDTDVWKRNCTCNITFEIEEKWLGKVVLYYKLGNFYQSHRRYVKSRDDNQLTGQLEMAKNNLFTEHNCNPYLTCESEKDCCNEFVEGQCTKPLPLGTVFLPCGAIANSMFSDEASLW